MRTAWPNQESGSKEAYNRPGYEAVSGIGKPVRDDGWRPGNAACYLTAARTVAEPAGISSLIRAVLPSTTTTVVVFTVLPSRL